ncbi:MAG: DNA translocase FtsK [Lachnospiraceae bacterium]|nr:DNA translocase FtsK [Lachnospiraceae bacterium]
MAAEKGKGRNTTGKNTTGTKKSSSTSSKKTAKSTNGKKQGTANSTQESFIRNEVVLLIVLAVSILLMLGNFKVGGIFGEVVNSFMFGMFGIMSYIMPIFLFLGTAFIISNKGNNIATIKIVAWTLLFLVLCIFFELIFVSGFQDMTIGECFTYSKEKKIGGGILGGMLTKMFASIFGIIGAYVIDIILAIISIVLITEKSFFQGVEKSSRRVYETAREGADRHRERSRERTRERQKVQEENRRRMDKKVSGVSMDLSLTGKKKSSASKEEIHEITIQGAPIAEQKLDGSYVDIFADAAPKQEPAVNIPMDEVHELIMEPNVKAEKEPPILMELPKEENFKEDPYDDIEETFKEEVPQMVQISESSQKVEPKVEPAKKLEVPKKAETSPVELQQVELPKDDTPTSPYKSTIDVGEEETAVEEKINIEYEFPPLDLLKRGNPNASGDSEEHLKATALKLQQTLQNFGVNVKITNVSCGPAVTRYELQPEQGVKVSKIVNLTDDIKLNMAAADIRIEAPIPGKAAVGIEIPNKESTAVMLRDLLEDKSFIEHSSKLAFAVGKDIGGQSVVTDIAKMPHLLIAGATGSGKSVCINTIIMSILYKARPDEVKLIMIDPKVVELSVYNGIPHLFIPVVTDPKKASGALNWAVMEMMERYQKFAELNVRDLKGYNEKIATVEHLEGEKPGKLPQIVIIVDELADLMMVAPGEVEDAICRLAQLARAAGIHLVIATQRPSVNVITGLIKANMPSRIAFAVSSGVDSRTILDMNGAEKLLGKGDMLFFPQGYQKPVRMQCAFVSDKEVGNVVEFLSNHNEGSSYSQDIEEKIQNAQSAGAASQTGGGGSEKDAYFEEAGKFIIDKDKASIGMLQRVFKIGFNRAARIMDQLAEAGVVGEEEGTKPRKVLMSIEEFEQYIEEYL